MQRNIAYVRLKKIGKAKADEWQREFDATICGSEKKRKSSVQQEKQTNNILKKVDPIKWQRKLLHRQSAMEFWVESPFSLVFYFRIQRGVEREGEEEGALERKCVNKRKSETGKNQNDRLICGRYSLQRFMNQVHTKLNSPIMKNSSWQRRAPTKITTTRAHSAFSL